MTRSRRTTLAIALLVAGLLGFAPVTDRDGPELPVPHPDPAFIEQVPGDECTYDEGNPYEAAAWTEGRYDGACKRIEFKFGPITVKPGQNDAILEPVDIEKPAYDGYIVRFKPDLVRSLDGSKPNTEDLHLHHATWLNLGEAYGSGPFFAAGEEKTIGNFPDGYGMEIEATDPWGLLYMVHNASAQSEVVWLTYTIDFVSKADGDALGIKPIKPIWLDVQKNAIHPDAPSTSSNPVFNVQRGFGHIDPETGHQVCTWPDENCARFDVYNNVTPQQGVDLDDEIDGNDWTVPADLAGTIVGLGGHLHPGGIRDEVSLVRDGDAKEIFISDALYWDLDDPSRVGAPPVSWNMSMTGSSVQTGWAVKVRAGDQIRINTVQDSEISSWYENMGIVVAYVVPDDLDDDVPSVDVFDDVVTIERGYTDLVEVPEGNWLDDWAPEPCTADLVDAEGDGKVLCLRGGPTHPAVPESGNGGTCEPNCPALPTGVGPIVTDIYSAGFTFGQADMGVIGVNGIPRVIKDEPVRLWNLDAPERIWHTFTRCKEPCTGPTTVSYPLANGGTGPDDLMDFETMNIGYGLMWEPVTSQIGGNEPYDREWVEDAVFYDFVPTETGTFSFYCRVHPGMRGAFQVVEGT